MYISTGNKKLAPTADTKFLIWNLPAEKTCPFATELCKKFCYAKKAERMYKGARNAREVNFTDSLSPAFTVAMGLEIRKYINRPSWRGKKVLFRIHESGDFYNKEYVQKWIDIANIFPNIQFLAYTKSVRFFAGLDIPENLTIRFSVWDDTKPGELAIARYIGLPTYSAVNKSQFVDVPAIQRCDCKKGCGDCQKCWNKSLDIITEIH